MRGRSTSSMTSRCSSLLLSASAEARSSGDDVIAFKGRIHRQWSSRTLNSLLIFTENLFENLMEYSSTLSVLFRGDPQPATSFYADGRSSDDVIAFWRYVLTQHPRCPTNPSDEQDLWERNLCINTPASEFGWMGYANQFIVFFAENLLENTDVVLRPPPRWFGAPHQCCLGVAACSFYLC